MGSELAGTAWPEVGTPTALVVPLGSLEQHGPHLPLDTDAAVAAELARRLVSSRPGLLLGPTQPYGASGEHEGFPGTVSIGIEVLAALLVELGRSASRWVPRLVIVNGHGGNTEALAAARDRLVYEGRPTLAWTPSGYADPHAGRTETSLSLALRPGLVRLNRAVPGPTDPLPALLPRLRAGGVAAVSPNGVLGDPAGASAEEGHELLRTLLGDLTSAYDAWLASAAGDSGSGSATGGDPLRSAGGQGLPVAE